LIETPSGVFLIDTPGLRELQLWTSEEDVEESFADIEALAKKCFFNDCTHTGESECAVQGAIETGALDAKRFENFSKMRKEAAYHERQVDLRAQLELKAKWKKIHKAMRHIDKRG
jgi:ribosome biogenesis GTPase